jgi:vancomycin resistance protein VanJ
VGERCWLTTVGLYLPRALFALPWPLLCFWLWRRRGRWLWLTQAAAALLLLFPLGGLVLPGAPRPTAGAPVLRVLAYNVMHAYRGPQRIMDEIDRFSPDVVLLVKLNATQEPMRQLLAGRYPHVAIYGGAAVASRFPILSRFDPDDPQTYEPAEQGHYVQAVIATPLGPIAFYACHPLSPRDGLAHAARLGGLGLLKAETAWREDHVRHLAERARTERLPVVIAGDTNLPDLSPLLRRQLSGYRDGFREAGWGFGYTFPTQPFRWMRIDRILASDSLRFVGFQQGSSSASDHLCVVADLQRREGAR